MPCEIGQNIYKLRKKNKELLDLLESNSALLESKIKMLRHATRSPKKSDLKNIVPSSPLKRRYASSSIANCTGAFTKSSTSESRLRPDVALNDNENISVKTLCDSKKTPAKRIKHISGGGGGSEIKKSPGRQIKERTNVRGAHRSNTCCYCSKIREHCKTVLLKPKENVPKFTKVKSEQIENTQCLVEPVHVQNNDIKVKFSKQSENHEENEISDVCLKRMDEARRLLNYSPESMFLRQMKQKLQTSMIDPSSKEKMSINQICHCENNRISMSDSESAQSVSPNADICNKDAVNDSEIGGNVHNQHSNNLSSRSDLENKIQCYCRSKKTEHKDAQFQTSEHLINSSTHIAQQKSSIRKKTCQAHSRSCLKTEGSKSQKNISKKASYGRGISSSTQHRKCQCKKQIGGLCCCEVVPSDERIKDPVSLQVDTVFSAPLKLSVSAPVISSNLKPCKPANPKQVSLEAEKSESDHPKSCIPNDLQTTGYDVIAALAENDRRKYAADPCTYQLEELSHFRQRHWFDCHAHPHGATLSEHCPDLKEAQNPDITFDDELMQPTLDPCIRAYRLNQRLFPEVVREAHGAGCCISHQGSCISPRLLPTQRRLVTLPSIPHQYTKEASATMKKPLGIETFPQSNILICDPVRMTSASNGPHAAGGSPSRLRRPVLSNSLALRFQKGVA